MTFICWKSGIWALENDLIKIFICLFTIPIWRQMPKDQDAISGLFKTIRIHQLWWIKRIYWLIILSRKAICDISLMHTNDWCKSTSWHTVMQERFKEESRQSVLPSDGTLASAIEDQRIRISFYWHIIFLQAADKFWKYVSCT